MISSFVIGFISSAKADTTYVNVALTKSLPPPDAVALDREAKVAILRLYPRHDYDSIGLLVPNLGYNSQSDLQAKQTEMLILIERGMISSTWCDSEFLDIFPIFRGCRIDVIVDGWSEPNITIDSTYAIFLKDLTQRLLHQTDTNSLAHLICRYYAKDMQYIYRRLHHNDFAGTCLQNQYDTAIANLQRYSRSLRFHWSVSGGIWMPTGANQSLGHKPELGINFGGQTYRYGTDAILLVRFLDTQQPYSRVWHNELHTTKRFVGWYVGFEQKIQLFTIGTYTFEVFGGVGYDWIGESEKIRVGSLALPIGFTQKLYMNEYRESYIGIQFRYQFVRYDTHGGSDLSGNTVSVNLVWGHLDKNRYARELNALQPQ